MWGVYVDLLGIGGVINYHCIIHQEQLCAKELGFDRLMKLVTDSINFIRSKGLNHRQFKDILDNDAQHNDLEFRSDLAFLVDITGHLNQLNKKLMGKDKFITELVNSVSAFKLKLQLFSKQLAQHNFVNFSYLKKMKERYPHKVLDYSEQIKMLQNVFENRFQDFETNNVILKLFADPFSVAIDDAPEKFHLELIDIQTSDNYKAKFRDMDILQFFNILPTEFLNLKENAKMCATMFGSTYICEQTFSLMNINKSKLRSRLTDKNLEAVLKISTSSIEPNIPKLVSQIQSHPSH